MLKTIDFWIKNARYQSFAQSFIPATLALLLVANSKDCNLLLGIFAVVGVVLAHFGANLFDDYFDYRSDAVRKRREMTDGGMRARSMKCAYVDSGQASLKQLFIAASIFVLIALALGGVIFYYRGISILICALIGAFLAFFYSAPPLRLSYHGLGEVVVWFLFGPAVMSGVSLSATGRIEPGVLFLAVPMGALVANILYVHSIMDLDPDKRAGKITLAALLGSQRHAVLFCGVLLSICYISIIVGVVLKVLSPFMLLALISIPLAYELYHAMVLYLSDPGQKMERKFRHGPMECWDMICKVGIDWFMFRWYLARNLTTEFALCLFVAIIVGYCF